jgi:hypothetical protein
MFGKITILIKNYTKFLFVNLFVVQKLKLFLVTILYFGSFRTTDRDCCQFWNLKYKSLKYILMAIDLQKLEQKFNALFEGDNFVTEFEQWLDARN